MPTVIDGNTGVSRVQNGALTTANLPSQLSVNASAAAGSIAVDASGRVRMPNQPMASVHSTTAGFIGTAGTVFPFDVAQVNIGSHYNTSTRRFTCPVAGRYFATVWVLIRNNSSGNSIGLCKNGAQVQGRGGIYTGRLRPRESGCANSNY